MGSGGGPQISSLLVISTEPSLWPLSLLQRSQGTKLERMQYEFEQIFLACTHMRNFKQCYVSTHFLYWKVASQAGRNVGPNQ